MAFETMLARSRGMHASNRVNGGGSSCSICRINSCCVWPSSAGRWAINSYNVRPSEYTSVRWSTMPGLLRNCSGLIYRSVPSNSPLAVIDASR